MHPPQDEPNANRLIHEKSPYLQQHARNPVDWYPWGDEAIARAKKEAKPIFLSVGYSTCHWCHVMERESFENAEIAAYLNAHFVCVKVDREEHPDVDQIYMNAVQAMTGQGGWPMSVFLTPELQPFYAGTYFPPDSRYGRPGFGALIRQLADLWEKRQGDLVAQGKQILAALETKSPKPEKDRFDSREPIHHAVHQLERGFDPTWGGFGGAPKFPRSVTLFLMLRDRLERPDKDDRRLGMVERTLEMMARGGMYDQVGGGFARYSTDAQWLVPHFEKMLYDNALLALSYAEGWQATRNPEHRRVAGETLDWVIKEMKHPDGGFYSAQDADSEGEEGKYYVWSAEEIEAALGKEDAALASEVFGIDGEPNFEGKYILHLPRRLDDAAAALKMTRAALDQRLGVIRKKLYMVRDARIHPGLDDKILSSWNGLMIAAMARCGAIFGEMRWVEAARAAADFVRAHVFKDRLPLRRWRSGEARFAGTLEDWANLAWGFLEIFESTGEPTWLAESIHLAAGACERFEDPENGGFFLAEKDTPHLVLRSKEPYDGATPSGNSVIAFVLLRLAEYTGRADFRRSAERAIAVHAAELERFPMAYPMLLVALDRALSPPEQIVVAVGENADEAATMLQTARSTFLPHAAIIAVNAANRAALEKLVPWIRGKDPVEGRSAAWICQDFVCKLPVANAQEMRLGRP